MVKIEVGFEPNPYEKAMVEQTKEDIQARLTGQEFDRFKIVLKKHQEIAMVIGDKRPKEVPSTYNFGGL